MQQSTKLSMHIIFNNTRKHFLLFFLTEMQNYICCHIQYVLKNQGSAEADGLGLRACLNSDPEAELAGTNHSPDPLSPEGRILT